MATTSQTYSSNSLIPTNTLASGSSTPTDDPNDTNSDFSSSSSTPLIVAFLAIGLFVAAVVCVFGWRHLSRSRGLGDQPIVPNRRRESISIGEEPMLWDVWADPKVPERSPIEGTRWDNITPMTAILTFLIPSVQPPVDPPLPIRRFRPMDPNNCMLFQLLKSLLSNVKRFYFPDPPPPPPLTDEKEVIPVSHASDDSEIEWGDASSLQVSVIISMPARQRCHGGMDTDPERMELGEYCIGTMDVPWK